MAQYLVLFDLPDELLEHIKKYGEVDWGGVGPHSDEKHVELFAQSLKITRESHGTVGDQKMHGLYAKGNDNIMAMTGTSPICANNARILTGLWNALHHQILHPPIGDERNML